MIRLASLLLIISPAVFAAEYQIDSAHSAAEFSVRHLMVSNVKGQFSKITGTLVYDPNNIEASKVEAVIDVSTVDTREPKRDGHLKSPDFFDAAKYPTMTFKSTGMKRDSGKLLLMGDLTMHGVTKPVTLTVDGPTPEIKDPQGNTRIGASATGQISRKDWGLVWNHSLEAGGVVVGDDVTITLDIEAIKAKTTTSSK